MRWFLTSFLAVPIVLLWGVWNVLFLLMRVQAIALNTIGGACVELNQLYLASAKK